MSKTLEQLNLRPQEKRILVVVGFVIFVVLNFWLVRPLFGEWGRVQGQLKKSQATLDRYQAEIANAPKYEKAEQQLKAQGGEVLTGELALQNIVHNQASTAGVMVSRYQPGLRTPTVRTNQFFEDQGLSIDFNSGGNEIIAFLVGLANANSMVHVHDMNVRVDGSGTKLMGTMQFLASYQKRQPAAAPTSAAAGAKTNAPAAAKTNAPAARKTNTPAKPATKAPPAKTNAANTAKAPK